MLPHHEAATMSHLSPPLLPSVSLDEKKKKEKDDLVTVSVAPVNDDEKAGLVHGEEDGLKSAPRRETFDTIYTTLLTLGGIVSILLLVNLCNSPVNSRAWADATLYLALQALFMLSLHSVSGIRRYCIGRRPKGTLPWYMDAAYTILYAVCFAYHYTTALHFLNLLHEKEMQVMH